VSSNIIRENKSRRMRWAGHVARMGEMRNVCKNLDENPEGQRPLRRHRRIWKDNIRMDLREKDGKVGIGCLWLRKRTSGGVL
jgi:hypothetical protein